MKIEPIPSQGSWELEYQKPQLLTKDREPTKAFRDFVSWLIKDQNVDISKMRVLDIGCGTGRNLVYLHENYGAQGVGVDIANTALDLAREYGPDIVWQQHDLDNTLVGAVEGKFDLIIDSTTSHLVGSDSRHRLEKDLDELLNDDGYVYLRTMTKDGDRNAHNLMKDIPGPEPDSYIHPKLGVAEYVWSQNDLVNLYQDDFDILYQKKYTGYQRWGVQSYKRRYVTMYLRKK